MFSRADPINFADCDSAYPGELGAGRINAFQAVYPGPIADFTANPPCGFTPLTVNFTDLSTGEIDSWSWDFGDGEISMDRNPSHTYDSGGTYTVSLTVSGPEGTHTKTDFIAVIEPGAVPNMEFGEVSVDHNWKQVNFTQAFCNPVVIAKPLSYDGKDPSVVRMRNVDGTGFEIRLQEWNYLNGEHGVEETVSYLVMEHGSHTLPDGIQVEAGRFVTDQTDSFTPVGFNQPFQVMPVVVAAVATFNESDAVTTRLGNITNVGFEFRMQEQELNAQSHSAEEIHYIAWKPGVGTVDGVTFFEVDTTLDVVTDQFHTISFGTTFLEVPRFLADVQSANDLDTAALRWQNRDVSGIEVKIEEEESLDSETAHTTEVVGYIAFALIDLTPAPVANFSAVPTSG
ncbi:MAG: PKD domain-containing protein, partial [Candidatus Thorarchaeota archaeon]